MGFTPKRKFTQNMSYWTCGLVLFQSFLRNSRFFSFDTQLCKEVSLCSWQGAIGSGASTQQHIKVVSSSGRAGGSHHCTSLWAKANASRQGHRPPCRFSAFCRRVTVPRHAAHTSSKHSNVWKLCVDAHYPTGPNKAKQFPRAVCPTSLAPCLSRPQVIENHNSTITSFQWIFSIPTHCKGASTSRQWFGKFFLVVSLDWFFAQALLDISLSFSRWSLLCSS